MLEIASDAGWELSSGSLTHFQLFSSFLFVLHEEEEENIIKQTLSLEVFPPKQKVHFFLPFLSTYCSCLYLSFFTLECKEESLNALVGQPLWRDDRGWLQNNVLVEFEQGFSIHLLVISHCRLPRYCISSRNIKIYYFQVQKCFYYHYIHTFMIIVEHQKQPQVK